jgi:hypothetical protein
LISSSIDNWSTTKKKTRTREPNAQYPSRRGACEWASLDSQQAVVQCSQWNATLRSKTLLLAYHYINLNPKRRKTPIERMKQAENRNKTLQEDRNFMITGRETFGWILICSFMIFISYSSTATSFNRHIGGWMRN